MTDHVLRAMTNDGAFRLIIVDMTETVTDIVAKQAVATTAKNAVGELLVSSVMVRETMAPTLRVQVILNNNAATVVADSHPDGLVRGLCSGDSEQSASLRGSTTIQVNRNLPDGQLHQGIVPTEGLATIGDVMTEYMLISEQIHSHVGLGVDVDAGRAVGYLVQRLPEATDEAISQMRKHTNSDAMAAMIIDPTVDTYAIMRNIFQSYEHTLLSTTNVFSGCVCSEAGVLSAISAIGTDEIKDMISKREIVEINCDYCGTQYRIGPERLQALVTPS